MAPNVPGVHDTPEPRASAAQWVSRRASERSERSVNARVRRCSSATRIAQTGRCSMAPAASCCGSSSARATCRRSTSVSSRGSAAVARRGGERSRHQDVPDVRSAASISAHRRAERSLIQNRRAGEARSHQVDVSGAPTRGGTPEQVHLCCGEPDTVKLRRRPRAAIRVDLRNRRFVTERAGAMAPNVPGVHDTPERGDSRAQGCPPAAHYRSTEGRSRQEQSGPVGAVPAASERSERGVNARVRRCGSGAGGGPRRAFAPVRPRPRFQASCSRGSSAALNVRR